MLIVEGPDLVGKTTFCRALVKLADQVNQFPAIYQHLSRLPGCWNPQRDYEQFISTFGVFDRFHVSEIVYGHCTRGFSRIDENTAAYLDEINTRRGGRLVLVYAESDDFLVEQFHAKDRAEMFDLRQIVAVNRVYRELAERGAIEYTYGAHEGQPGSAWHRYFLPEGTIKVAVGSGKGAWLAESPYVKQILENWHHAMTESLSDPRF